MDLDKWGLTQLWCKCKKFNLWDSRVNTLHGSQHLFGPYSFTHITGGMLQYLLFGKYGYKFNLLLHILWEVFENNPVIIHFFRKEETSSEYKGDSIANFIGDLICFSIGYYLSSVLKNIYFKIFAIILLEIIPYCIIKDNTTILIYISTKRFFDLVLK